VDAWIDIRRKAQACHDGALVTSKGNRRAQALVDAALHNHDLEIRDYEAGSIVSEGVLGFLDRRARLVNVAKHQDPADRAVVIAHEIGHFELHRDPLNEVTVSTSLLGGDSIDSGAGRVEGYSPRERKEVQADVFAGEFLCPSNWLRLQFVNDGKRPSDVVAELGLPLGLVMNQTIRALLLPPLRPLDAKPPKARYDLDNSQQAAVTWDGGPLLVDAGPGTGKTRTLVERIRHLLNGGCSPAAILALTFSNKAAEEMRDRLSSMNTDAAIEMWVGTFHAFGLELVTKWPSSVGRTGKVKVLDQAGSLALLEENLDKLPLRHYQNLYEPAYDLASVLQAISRCKDELISPAAYLAEAKAALISAAGDEEKLKAEKAVEIGEIYQIYEDELNKADAVDFGDLVAFATKLVETNPDVQKYIATFKNVLVDEYQDVNLASARLLRAIRLAGADIWVVADQRQSIYRFRGAEPTNVARFVSDFKGSRHALAINYRSVPPIVRTFERFSSSMGGGKVFAGSWTPNRPDGGEVTVVVAPTVAAEAEAIRDKIEELREKGVRYSDQAILARTHLTLARITSTLEKLGVPLLYLGDLFERDDIRTLLSLLSIDAESGGIGLIRVAALPAYTASRADALAIIRWSQDNRMSIMDALKRVEAIEGLTDRGRAGLAKLGQELDGLALASPWTLLTTWLFERSDYLLPLLAAADAKSQQKLVAIYHLLKVCAEQAAMGDSSRKAFLSRIRRIEALNQDSTYRAVVSEAADMDAVRVMTIHGSKGLEFSAVHFPALATRYMPSQRQGTRCPAPASLPQLARPAADHDAEEECLFFVGLSRARDYLCLSRAERYTTQSASPSKFLPAISGTVHAGKYAGSGATFSDPPVLLPPEARDEYTERELEIYLRCPARYRYEIIEGLRGSCDQSAYIRFHRCVRMTVRWLEEEKEEGHAISASAALAQLADDWPTEGPVEHGFEKYYRTAAEQMIAAMASTIAAETCGYDREDWSVAAGARHIVVTPDRVLLMPDGQVRVQRVRTGRETKSESGKPIYALLRRGAQARHPAKKIAVEACYLSTGKNVLVPAGNDDKGIQTYTDAIAAIEKGVFDPAPEPRICPNCQCYFMCRG
jgi:DNA helicase-2/ATP-dependent DNA helicase PcrA